MKPKTEYDEKHVVSRKRVTTYGEVYTRKREVNAMLDLVKDETERIDSRFLEPACGTGNFLTEILIRKLTVVETRYKKSQVEFEKYSLLAISSIYGIDLLEDNIIECRKRLYEIFDKLYTKLYKDKTNDALRKSIKYILNLNIIQGDALTLKTVGDNTEPIIFSEWSPVNGNKIKRRDFFFEDLIKYGHEATQLSVFKKSVQRALFQDPNDKSLKPISKENFAPTHFLKLGEPNES